MGSFRRRFPLRYPQILQEAMRYSVLAKDKGASPIIRIAACEAVGGSKEQALTTACALQMIHTASQIHHDLPCIDDQPIRRGQPSTHIVFGVDMAVWAADALFPLGFEYIVSATSQVPADRVVRGIAQGMQGPWDLRGSLLGSIWTWNGEETNFIYLFVRLHQPGGKLMKGVLLWGRTSVQSLSTCPKTCDCMCCVMAFDFQGIGMRGHMGLNSPCEW